MDKYLLGCRYRREHRRVDNFKFRGMGSEIVIDPAGEKSGLHSTDPGAGQAFDPFA